MSILDPKLLVTDELEDVGLNSSLDGTTSRGQYNPMQFVIRLRGDVHQALNQDEFSIERLQAFSTYLHENIHWWQHVGSNIGFISSLSYPVISHQCYRYLKALVQKGERFKSIIDYDKNAFYAVGRSPEINLILNNYHDITNANRFILDNKYIHNIQRDRRFFLSIGHCFHILWTSSISTLAATIDPEFQFLPNINDWYNGLRKLEAEKTPGFVTDGPMNISPLGTKAIFEGQARFNQLQYLAIGTKRDYSDFERAGMFRGVYIEAFNVFLKITEFKRPDNLMDSIVGLFLLICDIAINPTDGFPINPVIFETFIISNDPGMRFVMLCNVVRQNKEKWRYAVKGYTAQEYRDLSTELCKAIACLPPLYATGVVCGWSKKFESIQKLLVEEGHWKFSQENLPIRLFFSKYLSFQEDKLNHPEIFCWPGKHMTAEIGKTDNLKIAEVIFEKHKALFIEDMDGEIKPMSFKQYSSENIQSTFNAFYEFNSTYDLVLQWITQSGEFIYDYSWLSPNQNIETFKNWARNNFKNVFDINPEDLKIL